MQVDIFDLYFSQLVGIQHHPGALGDPKTLTLEQCAEIALRCVKIRNRILLEQE